MGNTQMENCFQCNAGNTVLAFSCNIDILEQALAVA
jgi:hypothetical protein